MHGPSVSLRTCGDGTVAVIVIIHSCGTGAIARAMRSLTPLKRDETFVRRVHRHARESFQVCERHHVRPVGLHHIDVCVFAICARRLENNAETLTPMPIIARRNVPVVFDFMPATSKQSVGLAVSIMLYTEPGRCVCLASNAVAAAPAGRPTVRQVEAPEATPDMV